MKTLTVVCVLVLAPLASAQVMGMGAAQSSPRSVLDLPAGILPLGPCVIATPCPYGPCVILTPCPPGTGPALPVSPSAPQAVQLPTQGPVVIQVPEARCQCEPCPPQAAPKKK
jgi:hypothetical protein